MQSGDNPAEGWGVVPGNIARCMGHVSPMDEATHWQLGTLDAGTRLRTVAGNGGESAWPTSQPSKAGGGGVDQHAVPPRGRDGACLPVARQRAQSVRGSDRCANARPLANG